MPAELDSVPYRCGHCSDETPADDLRTAHSGGECITICDECADDHFTTCDSCERLIESDELYQVRGGDMVCDVCPNCRTDFYAECHYCQDYHPNRSFSQTNRGHWVCSACEDRYHFTCSACDELCNDSEYAEDGLCEDCHSERQSSVILDYGADAPTRKYGTGPHYFGVELEVEARNRAESANDIAELFGKFAILKHDGSLESGFEIVTAPASFEEQKKRWKKFFDKEFRGLRSSDTDTCGLHVHCSKAPLSALWIATIVCFVNSDANRKFVERIAGRSTERWAKYHNKPLGQCHKRSGNRYEAVNLENSATIEFRIFKGTLKRESFFKAIEFCDAVIAFCRPGQRTMMDSLSLENFLAFVLANKKRWPHLQAFIDAKWHQKETKQTKAYGFTKREEKAPCA